MNLDGIRGEKREVDDQQGDGHGEHGDDAPVPALVLDQGQQSGGDGHRRRDRYAVRCCQRCRLMKRHHQADRAEHQHPIHRRDVDLSDLSC